MRFSGLSRIWIGTICLVSLIWITRFVVLEIENRVLSGRLEDLDAELADLREEMRDLLSSEDKLLQMANLQPRASIVVHPIPVGHSTPGIHQARLDTDHLLQEARRLKGSFYEIGDVLENDIDIRNHTPSISPVPRSDSWISSRFGRRRDPFTGALHMHRGVDICNRIGTPVIATADGKISVRRKDGNFGNYILIDHKYGLDLK